MFVLAHSNSDVYHVVPKHLAHTALCGERLTEGDAVTATAPAELRICQWCDDSLADLRDWQP